jgi:putative tricarboxylic transport membrane protein
MRANDAISGMVFGVLGIAMVILANRLPAFPGQKYGPDLFPKIIGGLFIACALMLLFRGLAVRRQGEPWFYGDARISGARALQNTGLILASIVVYTLVADAVGFIITSFVIMMVLFVAFGVPALRALLIAATMTVAFHWFFAVLFRIPLPRGILTNVL